LWDPPITAGVDVSYQIATEKERGYVSIINGRRPGFDQKKGRRTSQQRA
jgi:hypothetical protein